MINFQLVILAVENFDTSVGNRDRWSPQTVSQVFPAVLFETAGDVFGVGSLIGDAVQG
jgi:hypothetical protein